MGRIPVPGPFFSAAVAAPLAARALGATELLSDLADGSRRGTVALGEQGHGEPVGTVRTRARRKGAQWVLSGEKPAVVDGHTADWAIVVARSEEGRALLPARVRVRRRGTRCPGRARALARPHPQAGPPGARRHTGRAARAAREPAPSVAARPGRHRGRPGGGDRRRRRPGAGRGDRLHVRAGRLRQAGGDLPDGAPSPRRDVPTGRDGPGRIPVRRLGVGHRGTRAGPGRGHGRRLRRGGRRAGDRGRHPAARWRRLHLGQRRPLPLQAGEAERDPLRRQQERSTGGWPSSSSSRRDPGPLRALPGPAGVGRALPGRRRVGRPLSRAVPERRLARGPEPAPSHLVADQSLPRHGRRRLRRRAPRGGRPARPRARFRATSSPSSCPTGWRPRSRSTPAPCSA